MSSSVDGGTAASDNELLRKADAAMSRYAEGHDQSFDAIFSVVAPRVLRFLRRLCGAEELAQDLLQETLLKMHQARGAFRPGAAVLPWSYTIARNAFLDATRSRRRAPLSLAAPEEGGPPEPAVGAEAESTVLARESARAVERALLAMTEARREAFVLLRFEGMSVAEAAEILGASENAVKLRAFQAYEAIRAELERLEKMSPRRGIA